MFTGIITDVGSVAEAVRQGNAMRATIATALDISVWQRGCSVACSGVCLTVVSVGSREQGAGLGSPASPELAVGNAPSASKQASRGASINSFVVEISPETLACTTLGNWRTGTKVNLEPALKLGDELGGHIVSGHVDGVGRVIRCQMSDVRKEGEPVGQNAHKIITIETPAALLPLIAVKGSIVVDGVSLTVNVVEDNRFTVNLIPHTLAVTTLGSLKEGDTVNLEADMLARYVKRMMEFR